MKTRRAILLGMASSGLMLGQPKFALSTNANPLEVSGRPNLGFSLYGMKTLSLQQAIRECSEIGYKHIELSLLEGYPTALPLFTADLVQEVVSQLKQFQLSLPCMMIQLSLTADPKSHAKNLEAIRTAGTLAREINPSRPPLIETILGGNPDKWEEQKRGMVEQLAEWASIAEAVSVEIAIKAHIRSAVNSPERLLWLLESTKSTRLSVLFDYSHFELQGIGLSQSLDMLLDKTRFIHVKDSIGTANKFEFALPGEGKTDYVDYFSILRSKNYQGPVCVEVSGQVFGKPGYQPVRAAQTCFVVLQSALDKAYSS